jgi:hypothetical protein
MTNSAEKKLKKLRRNMVYFWLLYLWCQF